MTASVRRVLIENVAERRGDDRLGVGLVALPWILLGLLGGHERASMHRRDTVGHKRVRTGGSLKLGDVGMSQVRALIGMRPCTRGHGCPDPCACTPRREGLGPLGMNVDTAVSRFVDRP